MPVTTSSRAQERKRRGLDDNYQRRETRWRFGAVILSLVFLGATLWLVLTHLNY